MSPLDHNWLARDDTLLLNLNARATNSELAVFLEQRSLVFEYQRVPSRKPLKRIPYEPTPDRFSDCASKALELALPEPKKAGAFDRDLLPWEVIEIVYDDALGIALTDCRNTAVETPSTADVSNRFPLNTMACDVTSSLCPFTSSSK
jgi:hypothetical protein